VRGARALVAAAIAALAAAVAPHPGARADDASPHHLTKPDGSLDSERCASCHTPDMGLLMGSRLATCTLCHYETSHSGSSEHVRLSAELVAQALSTRPKGAVELPLTEQKQMWCGTCHLYHDPNVLGEKWLAQGWVPPDSGLAGAVRESLQERWARLAASYQQTGTVAKFATEGTRMLRLPVSDGTLCRQCHAGMAGSAVGSAK
jgi:hypothetical protein